MKQLATNCEQERKAYSQNAILLPPNRIMELEDPLMYKLFKKIGLEGDKISKHVLKHSHMNPTFLGLDWCLAIDHPDSTLGIRHDPYDFIDKLGCEEEILPRKKLTTRLFEHVAPFFEAVAKAIRILDGRLQVELILGDYIDVAERIQFDLFNDPDGVDEGMNIGYLRPQHFPKLYDCVSVRNLP